MNVLIVGASGLVGGNCLQYFKAISDWNVVGTYFSHATKDTVFYDTLDISNPKNFDIDAFAPNVILHCGALTFVDYCEDHIEESYEKTIQSTINMIELSKKYRAKMIFVSTDYIFDGKDGPYTEDGPTNALSIYGKHKLEAEQLVSKEIPNHIIIRVNNIYGDEDRGKNFVARILEQIFDGKKLTLKLPSDQYSTPINAYDIARCLYLLISDNHQGVFNISGTDFMSRVQLCLRILKYFPEAEYDLIPMETKDLNQPAKRPLLGGLINWKFMKAYPDFSFSNIDDYILQKIKKE
jgi:dTDP-4-dehydrorhamnose reductase